MTREQTGRASELSRRQFLVGTELRLVSFANISSSHQIGQVVQDLWTAAAACAPQT